MTWYLFPVVNAKDTFGTETGAEVSELVEQAADIDWRPLAGKADNAASLIHDDATPAEQLVAVIDAQVDGLVRQRVVEQDAEDGEPWMTRTAAIEDIGAPEDDVTVTATGATPSEGGSPNITVASPGAGVGGEEFVNTLLDPFSRREQSRTGRFAKSAPPRLPMAAAARFCGARTPLEGHGYVFVASASADRERRWTWTLIRRAPSSQSTFEYLVTADGTLPTASGTLADLEHGTVVKFFEYDLNRKSEVVKPVSLRGEIDRELWNPPVDVRLNETRYDRCDIPGVYDITTSGGRERMEGAEEVSDSFRFTAALGNGIGDVDVDAFVFHDDETVEQQDDLSGRAKWSLSRSHAGLSFVADGRVVARLGPEFLRSRCELYELARDTALVVDLTGVEPTTLYQIASTTPRNPKETSLADSVVKKVRDATRSNEELTTEEIFRRH